MKRLTVVIATGILLVFLPTVPAYASELTGPPDANGDWARCQIDFGGTTNNQDVTVDCNYGDQAGGGYDTVTQWRLGWRWNGAWQTTTIYETGVLDTATINSNGRFHAVRNINLQSSGFDPTGTCARGTGWTGSMSIAGTGRQFAYDECGVGVGADEPADWYPGSTHTLPVPDDPTIDCSRILQEQGGESFATFSATVTNPIEDTTTDTYSWDFGDGGDPVTTPSAQHVYDRPSMPDGGWTATITVERTGDGIEYDSSPVTGECSLRVDFRNPDQSEAGSTATDEADSDCPSGFGWLNPLAIVRTLKCLFIPSEDSVNSLSELWGDMTEKAPFSWAYEIITLPGDVLDGMATGAEESHSGNGTDTCKDMTGQVFGEDQEYTNCTAETLMDVESEGSSFGIIRGIFWLLFVLCTALAVYRIVVWTVS